MSRLLRLLGLWRGRRSRLFWRDSTRSLSHRSTFLTLSIATALFWSSESMSQQHALASDAARAALLSLRASLGDAERVSTFVLLPSANPLVEAQVLEALATMPKPVRLEAAKKAAGIEIRATMLVDPMEREFQRLSGEVDGKKFVDSVRVKHQCSSQDSLLLLRGAGSSVLITLKALEVMLRDFQIMTQVHATSPDSEARARNACATIVFSQTSSVRLFPLTK